MKNKKFFYCGEYFETEDEFWEGIKKFELSPMDEKSQNWLFAEFIKNLTLNLEMSPPKITNKEFRKRLEDCLFLNIATLLK